MGWTISVARALQRAFGRRSAGPSPEADNKADGFIASLGGWQELREAIPEVLGWGLARSFEAASWLAGIYFLVRFIHWAWYTPIGAVLGRIGLSS